MKAALYFLFYISYLIIGAIYTVNFNKDIDSTMGSYILPIFIWPIYMVRAGMIKWHRWQAHRIDKKMYDIKNIGWSNHKYGGKIKIPYRPFIKIK